MFDKPIDDYKQCKNCLELKPRDSFYKRSGRGGQYGDGLMGMCKKCHAAVCYRRRQERIADGDPRAIEVLKNAWDRWYEKNREMRAQRQRERWRSDPEYRERRNQSAKKYKERLRARNAVND